MFTTICPKEQLTSDNLIVSLSLKTGGDNPKIECFGSEVRFSREFRKLIGNREKYLENSGG